MQGGGKMYRYPVIIEKVNENYSAHCPDLPGCIARGKTIKEVLTKIKGIIQFHIEGMKEEGLSIPKPATTIKYINIAIAP